MVNEQFERVANGVSSLNLDLVPGIYKVRFRAGTEIRDQLTEVTADGVQTVVHSEPLPFANAAPIAHTSTTHEYQQLPAVQLSTAAVNQLGSDTALMLFVRDTEGPSAAELSSVGVYDIAGARADGAAVRRDDHAAQYAGSLTSLQPGTYRIRVETGAMGSYEVFVRTCLGWQTMVFLITEDFPYRGQLIRRPALRSASVLMGRAQRGFRPDDAENRLAEKAKSALEYGRSYIWDGLVQDLVDGKFENPMLGILGLHLGLLSDTTDPGLLATVVNNLANMVPGHPDVDAARLDQKLRNVPGAGGRPFPEPPMLRSSWNLVVTASGHDPSLVPPGSVFDLVAEWQVAGGPWLITRVPKTPIAGEFVHGLEATARFRELYQIVNDPVRRKVLTEKLREQRELNIFQRSLLEAASAWRDDDEGEASRTDWEPLTLAQLIQQMKVPACTIARGAAFLTKWASS